MISLVSHVAARSTNGNGFTTGSIVTTGASLLIASVSHYSGIANPTISDSKGNIWVALTPRVSPANFARNILYYVLNPTVGTGHTFTLTGNNTFGGICVAAFAGVKTTSAFESETGNSANASTSIQTGSLTPSEDNELIVSGLCLRDISNTGDTMSVNSGFTISDQNIGAFNQAISGALAYLIQGTAAAVNPTWSWTTSDNVAATIACFKADPTGGPSPHFIRRAQSMVGGMAS